MGGTKKKKRTCPIFTDRTRLPVSEVNTQRNLSSQISELAHASVLVHLLLDPAPESPRTASGASAAPPCRTRRSCRRRRRRRRRCALWSTFCRRGRDGGRGAPSSSSSPLPRSRRTPPDSRRGSNEIFAPRFLRGKFTNEWKIGGRHTM